MYKRYVLGILSGRFCSDISFKTRREKQRAAVKTLDGFTNYHQPKRAEEYSQAAATKRNTIKLGLFG